MAVGLAAAAGALAIAELVAVWVRPESSPVLAAGSAVIDAAPHWLKDFAVRAFGTADKPVLLGVIYLVLAGYAAAVGLLAARRLWLGQAGVALLGLAGVLFALGRPGAGPADVLPAVAGSVAGAWLLAVLATRTKEMEGRRTLLVAGAVAGVAVLTGAGARAWSGVRSAGTRSRAQVKLPSGAAMPAVEGTDLKLPGLPSFVTPNDEFYRIDTALSIPQVDAETWRLKLRGMVDRPRTITFAELLAMPMVERDITLTCVSNEVGGPLIGNARWLGVPLAPLLREAGIHPAADQLVMRSSDGWTCGSPVATLLDGRDALLAVGMNGQPLPIEHGFPVRVVVPGLYGYVSACKWLAELEVSSFAEFDAYWVRRGWSAQGPIKTSSRIDTPRGRVRAGPVQVAGVAWAQHRGIAKVEVQVGDGPWQEARLAAVPSSDTWRQWVHTWEATPGEHRIRVRATDGTGQVQTTARAPVAPDGATGLHEVSVRVG